MLRGYENWLDLLSGRLLGYDSAFSAVFILSWSYSYSAVLSISQLREALAILLLLHFFFAECKHD